MDELEANRLDKLHSPLAATEWKPLPFPIWTAYVNFGHPSLPIYQNSRYFAMDLNAFASGVEGKER